MIPEEIAIIQNTKIAKLSQASRDTNPLHPIYKKIIDGTGFLDVSYPDKNISFSLRVKCILSGYTKTPVCAACENETSIKNYSSEFNQFCSDECRKKNNNVLPIEVYNKLNDYDWFYENRITNQLSYFDMGALLGISETPVREYARKHGLNKQKYNESSPFTKAKLRDKEFLYTEHVTNHRTCDDIAIEIGSSKATVSSYLAMHNIITNPSNSYDREPHTVSRQENEISEYIRSLGHDVETSNRTILNGYEIDIVIPALKIGIEHHGLYAHAYKPQEAEYSRRKDHTYHRMKYLLAKKNGYHLIQIFGDQWQFNQDIVKSVIASKLGNTKKIYARKCEIREIPNGIKNKFLNENHLQGQDRSSIRYGLECQGELVAVMTFNKTKYSKEFDWELTRYCGRKFHTVVGGFSKLLSHFRKNHTGSIVSYSDSMWSNGGAYEKNGFTLVRENKAGYFYVTPDRQHRIHRNNFRKSKISVVGDTRTEEEIMYENKYMKIFDAGNTVWAMQ